MAENPYPDGLPIAPDTPMPPRRYIRWGGLPSAPSEDRNDEHRNAAWERGFVEGHAAAVADIVKLLRHAVDAAEYRTPGKDSSLVSPLAAFDDAADLIESRYPTEGSE